MDGNTRFARTFRLQQYTLDALVRIAQTQSTADKACTLTDALELAVLRTDSQLQAARHAPSTGELRAAAAVFSSVADGLDELTEDELAAAREAAPPADEYAEVEVEAVPA